MWDVGIHILEILAECACREAGGSGTRPYGGSRDGPVLRRGRTPAGRKRAAARTTARRDIALCGCSPPLIRPNGHTAYRSYGILMVGSINMKKGLVWDQPLKT